MQTIAAAVLRCFYNLNRVLEVKTNKGLHWAVMTADELNESSNTDLRRGRRRTHGCGRAAEVRRRFLVRVRLMVRPESVKIGSSTAAAAELERRQ